MALLRCLGALCGCSSSNPTMTGLTPDFSLSVSTQSVFVPTGVHSENVQLSIVASNGFSQPVSVSVRGLPMGVTSTPTSPFTMNAGTSQTVSFSPPSGQSRSCSIFISGDFCNGLAQFCNFIISGESCLRLRRKPKPTAEQHSRVFRGRKQRQSVGVVSLARQFAESS